MYFNYANQFNTIYSRIISAKAISAEAAYCGNNTLMSLPIYNGGNAGMKDKVGKAPPVMICIVNMYLIICIDRLHIYIRQN